MQMKLVILDNEVRCSAIAFADNIDLVEGGLKAEENMKNIIKEYDDLYSASSS